MDMLLTCLIAGARPSQEIERRLREVQKLPAHATPRLSVFHTRFNRASYYVCWAAGSIRNGEAVFSLTGRAAAEALGNLPVGDNRRFIMQELRLSHVPLRQQVETALREAGADAKVCFFGRMDGELDEHLNHAFNVIGRPVSISALMAAHFPLSPPAPNPARNIAYMVPPPSRVQ